MKAIHVLVIEDDLNQQNALKKMIQDSYPMSSVVCASNPEQALKAVSEQTFDVLFVDIDLGSNEINGFHLALKIRENPKYALTWIIFLTVRTDFERVAFKTVHCYDYLNKPYDEKIIATLLNTLFNKQPHLIFENEDRLVLTLENMTLNILSREIMYIEAKVRGVSIATVNGYIPVPYCALKKVEESLKDQKQFVKTHRSFLVNHHYIKRINKVTYREYVIDLHGSDDRLPLSASLKHQLLDFPFA